ncbi:C-terminal binding protein (plasmid) [Arthrobacter agilis]|uniref:C-terminal binding protein n=1 Tax=Arthrobacter agilis TaxID=37921 RepID=UPI00236560A0|nr:C-terminal binding protein [Arthrobacter agilis]WDF35297.1 C-terminal binding protein [Arthrobacter agilis]
MRVILTDQVFPTVSLERDEFSRHGHEFLVASNESEALTLIEDADAILTTYMPLPAKVIGTMKKARIIARYGIGVDNIDVRAAAAKGIAVTNVPDYCVEEVATHAVAMALAMVRGLPSADAAVRQGEWGVNTVRPLRRLSSLTVGLLGVGRIGGAVARTLATLGPKLIAHDPYAAELPPGVLPVSLEEVFKNSDLLLLHAPLTEATKGLVNASRIDSMKDGAYIVNVARGPLIVLEDLLAALRSGKLRGAGIDTFPQEPLPDVSILEDVPGLLLSPHTAFYSEEALVESQRKAIAQVVKVLHGQSPDYLIAP